MAKAFHSPTDVNLRLNGTICFHNGEPVWVSVLPQREGVPYDPNRITLTPTTDPHNYTRGTTIDYRDDAFSYNVPKLGYVNMRGGAVYVMRTPVRVQKAGLCANSISVEGNTRYTSGDVIYSKEFVKAVKGEYPTIPHALRKVADGEMPAMAYHIDCAFELIGNQVVGLKYKNRWIGVRAGGDAAFRLFTTPEASILQHIILKTGLELI